MLIVLANELPPAVRGRMKLWFVEPRPNVFISGLKDSIAIEVVNYLYEHCPPVSGVLLIRLIKNQILVYSCRQQEMDLGLILVPPYFLIIPGA